jgi:urea carboxylase
MAALEARGDPAIIDLTPGVRSLQIHYDCAKLPLEDLVALLRTIDAELDSIDDVTVASRIVHLPLSWNDDAIQQAIDKYAQSVRPDAPWCPSNIEFIRRMNGLASIDEVRRIVFEASYLVLGLGDVYLGAPVATPVDPRHRLVTTKYNPARTWTAENSVGIGGAYMCVYGMEGPGGYQLFGRTCQMWNTYRATKEFEAGKPWLLRFFDQVRFHPVSAGELVRFREGFRDGTVSLDIEPATFSLKDYRAFLAANRDEIGAFKSRQQAAFEAERARWQTTDQAGDAADTGAGVETGDEALPDGATAVPSPVPGSVWKLAVTQGARVAAGDVLVVVESMKMEMSVVASMDGIVHEVRCAEGRAVALGQTLIVLTEIEVEAAQ